MSAFPAPAIRKRGPIVNGPTAVPGSTQMMTLDASGNIATQSIPVASFAALTGAPNDNTALAAALAAKAASVHTHVIADTTGLQTALDGKAASVHTHVIADTTGLQTALDAKLNLSGGTLTGKLTLIAGGDDYAPNALAFGASNRGFTAATSSTGAIIVVTSNGQCVSFSNTALKLASNRTIDWSGNADNAGTATQAQIVMPAYGQIDVRGNLGFRSRNAANSGDAPISGSNITASDNFQGPVTGVTFGDGYSTNKVKILNSASSISNGINQVRIDNGYHIVWSGAVTGSGNVDLGICRVGVGQLDIRGDSGARFRNYANSAWTQIQCGTISANGLITANSGVSVINQLQPGDATTGLRIADGFNGDRARVVSRFATISGSFDQLRFDSAVDIAWCANVATNSADIRLNRNGAGTLRILANSGLQIQDLAGSSWAALQCGTITANAIVFVGVYTVATLPSAAANAGALAQVTDSSVTANGSAVAGGGSNRVVVFSNGSAWDVVVA